MPYIALISDTHGLFDDKLRSFISPVDELWHAGDFGTLECARAAAACKPMRGVSGNCDDCYIRMDYPHHLFFECGGMKVLMVHIGGYPGRYDRRARQLIEEYRPDIFVCGHSHILKVVNDLRYNMLVINPGAAGVFGFHKVRTALRFRISEGRISDMEVCEWDK